MTEFSAGWILEVLHPQPGYVDCLGNCDACSLVVTEITGISVQVVAELDGQKPKIPLERSGSRQCLLECRSAPARYGQVFEVVDALGITPTAFIPFVDPRQHPVQLHSDTLPRSAVARLPLLLVAPHAACEVSVQDSRIMCTTRILTSDPGPACRCTRSSTCSYYTCMLVHWVVASHPHSS